MNDIAGLRDQSAIPPGLWEDFVRDHMSQVQRHAFRLTGHPQEAEDLAQEVFIRAFQKVTAANPVSIDAWLYRVTTNLYIDSARRRRCLPQDPLSRSLAGRLVGVEPSPDEALDAGTFDQDVEAALKGLSPSHHAAVVLCDVEGLSYLEVASRLGIKLGTARSQIHRGRAQMRVALAHRSTGLPWESPRRARGELRRRTRREPWSGAV